MEEEELVESDEEDEEADLVVLDPDHVSIKCL